MEDHGLSAAMTMARLVFEQSSRRSGRTDRLLQRVRPGDQIVVPSSPIKRHLVDRLRDLDKSDVEVIVLSPEKHPMDQRGTNPRGAMLFEHTWIEAWWARKLREIADELAMIEGAMSKVPPPRIDQGAMDWRFEEYRHRA